MSLQGVWRKLKRKNPKITVMSPTFETKDFKKEEVVWQQYHLCIDVAQHQILGGKILLILRLESGKIWWLNKVQYFEKKYHCQWALLRVEKNKWIVVVPTKWQIHTVLGDCISRAKVIPAPAPQYRQHAPISDFLDLAHLSVGHQDGPIYKQLTGKSNCRRPLRNGRMRIFGPRETIDPSRQLQGIFPPHVAVLRRHCLPNVYFQCCTLLHGTLGHDFDIFSSRPIGVRVCPVAQFDFFSTAFDPREWTMVVIWKEDSGRQLRLITLDQDLPSLMILMFLLKWL